MRMPRVHIDGQEYVPVPGGMPVPVAGEWHPVPVVEGRYWMATRRPYCRKWYVEFMPVRVAVGANREVIVRPWGSSDWKALAVFPNARFLGPFGLPAAPAK